MRKISLLFIVFCLVCGLTFGQEYRTEKTGYLATFQGLNNLAPQNFDGGFGAVIHFEKFAIRPIFNINVESETNDDADTKNSEFNVDVTCDFLKYLSNSRINPYLGAGVGFGIGKEKFENGITTETSVTEFLLRGIAGVEIFLFKNFSVSFEYRLTYTSVSRDFEMDNGLTKAIQSMYETDDGDHSSLYLSPSYRLQYSLYLPCCRCCCCTKE